MTRPLPEKSLDVSSASVDQLQRLVAAKLQALLVEAEKTEGSIPREGLSELQALAGLLDISEKLRPVSRRKRWPIACALVLTLVVMSVLLFFRVPRTEIELEASVSEVAFRVPAEQALIETARLQFLGIAGIAGFDPPNSFEAIAPTNGVRRSDVLAFYATDTNPQCQGGITLDRIILPRAAQVWLRRSSVSNRIQLSLKAPGAAIRATIDGCVMVGGSAATKWMIGSPKTLTIQVGTDDVDLDFESTPGARIAFVPVVRASALLLTRIEQVAREDVTIVRHVSTITAGNLYYQSLNGEERKLRFAEPIRFAHADGEIRSIELDHGQIAVRFHGDVRGMVRGTEANARSLMPTFLDWLKANHSLSLLWGSAMYIFGLAVLMLKWWKLES